MEGMKKSISCFPSTQRTNTNYLRSMGLKSKISSCVPFFFFIHKAAASSATALTPLNLSILFAAWSR